MRHLVRTIILQKGPAGSGVWVRRRRRRRRRRKKEEEEKEEEKEEEEEDNDDDSPLIVVLFRIKISGKEAGHGMGSGEGARRARSSKVISFYYLV